MRTAAARATRDLTYILRESSRRSSATAMRKILACGRAARNSLSKDMVPLPKIGPGQEFPKLQLGPRGRVFVLTGAGISAESGVKTFRDAGGLWEEHRIEDVASPEGFRRDPLLVWRFYSLRRAQAKSVEPNAGHRALVELEERLGD